VKNLAKHPRRPRGFCAGSGKTEVVARRVVQLLTPGRPETLLPRNIIAFTFTDKAAAELKERIVTRTRESLGNIPGLAEMFVGTIHAFCLERGPLARDFVPNALRGRRSFNRTKYILPSRDSGRRRSPTESAVASGTPLRRSAATRRESIRIWRGRLRR
jgi:DNA helicase-2/ATP-dependent DNA helicase PcrA